tara:strand:+ start:210 stop:476 length:267 start_codon:yes stop_codon:yes gene_type:complete
MKKILFIFSLLVTISVFSQEKKRLALVIGNSNYEKGPLPNPVSHVGVYVGDNTFIHSPKTNDYVKKTKISGYWKDKLVGFININLVIK